MRAVESRTASGTRSRSWSVTATGVVVVALGAFLLVNRAHADTDKAAEPKTNYSFTAESGANGEEAHRAKSSLFSRLRAKREAEEPAAIAPSDESREVAREASVPAENALADESRRPKSSFWTRVKERQAAQAAAEKTTRIEPVAAKVNAKSAALTTSADPAPPEEADASASADDGDVPESLTPTVADPLEPVNRVTFTINEGLDFAVFRPVSFIYRHTIPGSVRGAISNALHNFSTPVILANDLLQGRPDRAGKTLMRFFINSTAGFGGLADMAAGAGMERHSEDFGQTLAVWGFGQGIYIVVPVFGPSTTRDGAGRLVDLALDPATWVMWDLAVIERLSPTIAYAVSGHEELMDEIDSIRKTSPDFYASMRDIYIQKRASDIANGAETLEPIEPEPNR